MLRAFNSMELVLDEHRHILKYNETAGAQWGVRISTVYHLIEVVKCKYNEVAFATSKMMIITNKLITENLNR